MDLEFFDCRDCLVGFAAEVEGPAEEIGLGLYAIQIDFVIQPPAPVPED
jgi:hypothetical protein